MITEDYVSFEIAKLLKEKGFDEKCQKVYMHNGQLLRAPIFMEGESFVNNKDIELVANYNDWITYTQGEYAYLCPTLQMACKWLREKHKIFIRIVEDVLGKLFELQIYQHGDCKLHNRVRDFYEEAFEAAIKYVLENLI